jgi:hypothetical protein
MVRDVEPGTQTKTAFWRFGFCRYRPTPVSDLAKLPDPKQTLRLTRWLRTINNNFVMLFNNLIQCSQVRLALAGRREYKRRKGRQPEFRLCVITGVT